MLLPLNPVALKTGKEAVNNRRVNETGFIDHGRGQLDGCPMSGLFRLIEARPHFDPVALFVFLSLLSPHKVENHDHA